MPVWRSMSAKPMIKIVTEPPSTGLTYTTCSAINGTVDLCAHEDLTLKDVRISLIGCGRRSLEVGRNGSRSSDEWIFLSLHMPIDGQALETCCNVPARQQRPIPFHFRVPRQLPTGTCNHTKIAPCLQDQHLCLPPTICSEGADAMCPDLISIGYYIEVVIETDTTVTPSRSILPQDHRFRERLEVTILPTFPEEAPLDLESHSTTFMPRATLSLKRHILGRTLGHVEANAYQPNAIMLKANGGAPSTSSVHIGLAFSPHSETVSIPHVERVCGDLVSNTYFGPRVLHEWPQRLPEAQHTIDPLLNYKVTTPIINYAPGELNWTEGSVLMAVSRTCYRTSLEIPFGVHHVRNKRFMPTFHCCLFSRTYTLVLKIAFSGGQSIRVTVPLQVGVEDSMTQESLDPQGARPPDY
ncbi:uncharacterized protein F5Z01DRAFT_753012 [Emericellopsis atlantica]|uniref:Bul1 C-terminal domain-containing protein n=1 Tax=Emericellopsis atlantica TaxID=2614577 RepID=A0A9P7ZG59_9HYPO|nr:uncharacterized protein F5Z01DRAFT_753012 [Emericellopsis atlantica]KAG9251121.1 hypothetical protein F5Z01DRAFT_753012 [Emericellopsis atlantica]